ncbi:hypothetical protein MYU51_011923 [Penicillium brevicompactum]|uniref:uncharacterized protein n=1 Tax=Penicillium brevicompactum TaxID=5074 RepID=UPI00253F6BF5|nr:uncharacterized protein N7506_002350 [Penicillium brevicompactum]KAJ5349097.1 hypothetical protein N7506_002350 [Penicillium brevicompactum]
MAEDMPTFPGLDRWHLLCRIGKGAFSEVFRAQDTQASHDEVAIKIMRKREMNSQQNISMCKEIEIMRQMDHPNLIQLIDTIDTDEYCYIIMELCTGGELFNQVVKLTYLSEDLSRHVILQVARAVQYLHQTLGIVHRDIKPENILFHSIPLLPSKVPKKPQPGEEKKMDEGDFAHGVGSGGIGTVKLGDFGFSKKILGNLTATPCGTMGYAAPEIVDDQKYSTGVDMWALGCVLFALLAGYPPFYDPNIKILMKRVIKGQFHFDSPWWDNISDTAKDLVRNLLTVDPAKRYTIDDFMAHPWIREASQPDHSKQEPTQQSSSLEVPSQLKQQPSAGSDGSEPNPLPSPASLAIRGQVECRTPDVMNVAEIFDVAFSVHQIEDERRRQERIMGKLSSTNSADKQMSQLSLSGPKGVNRLSFMVEPTSPEQNSRNKHTKQSELNLDQSALLEKRRTRQQNI